MVTSVRGFYFLTHPNVLIEPNVPVPQWCLSDKGRDRMVLAISASWAHSLTEIYSSTEVKAIQTAQYFATALSLPVAQRAGLGENDRSSTGFLKPDEFETVADQFFANPMASVRGWETASDTQGRIVQTVTRILTESRSNGDILIAAHGAVGTLLYCHLMGVPISRKYDQPSNGGGNFYYVDCSTMQPSSSWRAIDAR